MTCFSPGQVEDVAIAPAALCSLVPNDLVKSVLTAGALARAAVPRQRLT